MFEAAASWAEREFGGVELGDERRTRRLVQMAATAARAPTGRVSRVFTGRAEREAAYRLVESTSVDPEALTRAMCAATARRCGRGPVIVAVDEMTLSVADPLCRKGLGKVGGRGAEALRRGLECINALAVSVHGTTLGLLGQHWWRRPDESGRRRRGKDQRPPSQRESRHWSEALGEVDETLAAHAPELDPWYQMDRGADIGALLVECVERGRRVTIRAAQDRLVEGSHERISAALAHRPVRARVVVPLARTARREARTATMALRFERMTLRIELPGRGVVPTEVGVVHLEERRPGHHERVRWTLLTTAPLDTVQAALAVVGAYTLRWRVEDFHRAWKGGHCDVESCQLESADAVRRWATILAAVATRAERIKLAVRLIGHKPATAFFGADEVRILLSMARDVRLTKREISEVPPLKEAVNLLAALGGYTGSITRDTSRGPPGLQTIARGLEKMETMLESIRHLASLSG